MHMERSFRKRLKIAAFVTAVLLPLAIGAYVFLAINAGRGSVNHPVVVWNYLLHSGRITLELPKGATEVTAEAAFGPIDNRIQLPVVCSGGRVVIKDVPNTIKAGINIAISFNLNGIGYGCATNLPHSPGWSRYYMQLQSVTTKKGELVLTYMKLINGEPESAIQVEASQQVAAH